MTIVTIKCPITWYEQCEWIYNNCKYYKDQTVWWIWQIGYDDIYFELDDRDAIMFTLVWS